MTKSPLSLLINNVLTGFANKVNIIPKASILLEKPTTDVVGIYLVEKDFNLSSISSNILSLI